jgi:hypothetical protein
VLGVPNVTTALWILGAGVGVFTVAMVLSLCIVAARPTPPPPGLGIPTGARARQDGLWANPRPDLVQPTPVEEEDWVSVQPRVTWSPSSHTS